MIRTWRLFREQPLYAITFVVTLALAAGAAATSFAVVKRALLDPLPYPDGDRLVHLQTQQADNRTGALSIFVFQDLERSQQDVLRSFAPFRFNTVTFQSSDLTESVQAHEVTEAYFTTLGVRPMLGGTLPPADPATAVISWKFWQQRLSADPGVVGKSIVLDGVPRQVVGVMPREFLAPYGPDLAVWLPLDTRPLLADTARARRTITVLARLSPGVTLAQAGVFMETFSDAQRAQYPAIHSRERWMAQSLHTGLIGPSETPLAGVAAAAALLMLIVCANIAGLSAVHAAARRRAYAIQAALGASAGRMFRDRLTDSAILSAIGSTAGVWLAYALIAVAARYQDQFLPMLSPVAFEWSTALVGWSLGIATGLVAAIAPQGAVKRLQVEDALRSSRGATGDRRLASVRSGLVFVQVATTIVLIVSAGLLTRTIANLSSTTLGFDSDRFTVFHVTLPLPSYRGTERHLQFERAVQDRVGAIPGVTGVSASVGFPVMGSMGARLWILDQSQPEAPPEIGYFSVTPGFFRFLDVPILEGRDIAETDDFPAPRVVVINETMAKMFWPQGNAIGAKVKIGAGAASDREIIVVGIAGDVRQNGPMQDVRPAAFGSTLQYSWPRRHIAVKTDRRLAGLGEQLAAAVRDVDPAVATTAPQTVDYVVAQQMARHRLVMLTLAFFGSVATLLCGLGLYATVALSSQSRRREYAIRLALGSTRAQVCWLVMRQALALGLAGAVVGLILASAGTQALSGLLHGVTPVDRVTFAAALAAMVAVAGLSASMPAIRAGRVNPGETLHAE